MYQAHSGLLNNSKTLRKQMKDESRISTTRAHTHPQPVQLLPSSIVLCLLLASLPRRNPQRILFWFRKYFVLRLAFPVFSPPLWHNRFQIFRSELQSSFFSKSAANNSKDEWGWYGGSYARWGNFLSGWKNRYRAESCLPHSGTLEGKNTWTGNSFLFFFFLL